MARDKDIKEQGKGHKWTCQRTMEVVPSSDYELLEKK
jgi:hypothetical protein